MTAVVAALAVLGFYAFVYRIAVKRAGPPVRAVVALLHLDARHPVREVEAVGKLAAAAAAQLLFAAVLMTVLGIRLDSVIGFQPHLVLVGSVLGIGELALAGFVSTVVLQVAALASGQDATDDWLRQGRAGWMRYFTATMSTAPPWLAAAIIALYVGVEELVFRGILITAASSYGAAVACALSTTLFVAAQAFGMPSLRAALFPVAGAAIVGPVHAILFWHVHDVLPLIAAHLVFFTGALRLATDRRAATAGARPW
jgi:membrane protease YdiL (CAAX protease family)